MNPLFKAITDLVNSGKILPFSAWELIAFHEKSFRTGLNEMKNSRPKSEMKLIQQTILSTSGVQ